MLTILPGPFHVDVARIMFCQPQLTPSHHLAFVTAKCQCQCRLRKEGVSLIAVFNVSTPHLGDKKSVESFSPVSSLQSLRLQLILITDDDVLVSVQSVVLGEGWLAEPSEDDIH